VADAMKSRFEEHQRVVSAAAEHVGLLERIADRIIECFNTGGRLFILGNGGSAADAQHIAAELVGRFKHDRKALPAVALTTDTSILTAVSNDIGAENCFLRQIEALVTDRDTVWALSVSGTSPNVIRAMKRARAIGALTVGFTGRSGGELKDLCELCFRVDHDTSDRVQEVHQLAYHVICEHIERTYMTSTL
jgi:D-sedoheptulose 7-phosphate isomerase